MSASPQGKYVVPNERIPKMIGILNINFASLLLIVGLCSSLYYLITPFIMNAMSQAVKQVEQKAEQAKQAELAALEQEETAAKTPEEKTAIAVKRAKLEARKAQMPPMMDLSKMGMDSPKIRIWAFGDTVSAITLNVLMMASGIGLLGLRRWARSMAIWTAWLKILRLAISYGFMAFAIVPELSQKIGEAVGGMMAAQGGPALPVDRLVFIYTVFYTVASLGVILFGSIYPVVVVVLLTRKSVKAAFSAPIVQKPVVERGLS